MTDLLISLIKIEDRYFPAYQAVDRDPTSDRRDNAKLGEMRSDRIDHCSLPMDEEMARVWFPIGIGFGLSRIGFVEETTHFELVERATASKSEMGQKGDDPGGRAACPLGSWKPRSLT